MLVLLPNGGIPQTMNSFFFFFTEVVYQIVFSGQQNPKTYCTLIAYLSQKTFNLTSFIGLYIVKPLRPLAYTVARPPTTKVNNAKQTSGEHV